MPLDGTWVRERLADISRTQTDLGKVLEMDKAQTSRMLDGKRRVQVDDIEPMAIFLGVTVLEMCRRCGLRL